MIPKIIWQTHELPYDKLPNFQKNIINTWKNLNPEWEHIYADSDQRAKDVKEYSEILYSYYSVSGKLHQSDIWRLVVTYSHGGFYADMDSVCVQDIEKSLSKNYNNKELICSPFGFQHIGIASSNFGSTKNNKIIKSMIDTLITKYNNTDIKNIPNFPFAYPENHIFSIVAQENYKDIYFTEEYYCHSKDFKEQFDPKPDFYYNNGKIIKYLDLSSKENWIID